MPRLVFFILLCLTCLTAGTYADGSRDVMTYNAVGQLISAASGKYANSVSYEYDAMGRRIAKTVTVVDDETPTTTTTTTIYIHTGPRVIAEYTPVPEPSGGAEADNPTQCYGFGPYIDEPVAMIKTSGAGGGTSGVFYYHHNQQYSVIALSGATGTVTERYAYDAYGKPTIYDGTATTTRPESLYNNPYLYTARRYDPETGLYYFRARYYDANLGRFLARDPLGYVDGMSLYRGYFVPNSVDPWGLDIMKKGGDVYVHTYEHMKATLRGYEFSIDSKTNQRKYEYLKDVYRQFEEFINGGVLAEPPSKRDNPSASNDTQTIPYMTAAKSGKNYEDGKWENNLLPSLDRSTVGGVNSYEVDLKLAAKSTIEIATIIKMNQVVAKIKKIKKPCECHMIIMIGHSLDHTAQVGTREGKIKASMVKGEGIAFLPLSCYQVQTANKFKEKGYHIPKSLYLKRHGSYSTIETDEMIRRIAILYNVADDWAKNAISSGKCKKVHFHVIWSADKLKMQCNSPGTVSNVDVKADRVLALEEYKEKLGYRK